MMYTSFSNDSVKKYMYFYVLYTQQMLKQMGKMTDETESRIYGAFSIISLTLKYKFESNYLDIG